MFTQELLYLHAVEWSCRTFYFDESGAAYICVQ